MSWVDPMGLEVRNYSHLPVRVKIEEGNTWGIVPAGMMFPGKIDAVVGPYGDKLAVPGKTFLPDNTVSVSGLGQVSCTGGLCKLLPAKDWHPSLDPPNGDLQPLPGCKPL